MRISIRSQFSHLRIWRAIAHLYKLAMHLYTLNLKELCPCGGRVNRRGALRAAVQGVLAGFLRVAPTSHARQCTAPLRLMPAPRAPAASRGKGKCWPSRPRWTCAHAHRGGGGQGARGAFRGHFSGLAAWHRSPRWIYSEIVITFLIGAACSPHLRFRELSRGWRRR